MGALTNSLSNSLGVQLGALLNLNNILAITIDGTEYELTMDLEEQEYYIEMT